MRALTDKENDLYAGFPHKKHRSSMTCVERAAHNNNNNNQKAKEENNIEYFTATVSAL